MIRQKKNEEIFREYQQRRKQRMASKDTPPKRYYTNEHNQNPQHELPEESLKQYQKFGKQIEQRQKLKLKQNGNEHGPELFSLIKSAISSADIIIEGIRTDGHQQLNQKHKRYHKERQKLLNFLAKRQPPSEYWSPVKISQIQSFSNSETEKQQKDIKSIKLNLQRLNKQIQNLKLNYPNRQKVESSKYNKQNSEQRQPLTQRFEGNSDQSNLPVRKLQAKLSSQEAVNKKLKQMLFLISFDSVTSDLKDFVNLIELVEKGKEKINHLNSEHRNHHKNDFGRKQKQLERQVIDNERRLLDLKSKIENIVKRKAYSYENSNSLKTNRQQQSIPFSNLMRLEQIINNKIVPILNSDTNRKTSKPRIEDNKKRDEGEYANILDKFITKAKEKEERLNQKIRRIEEKEQDYQNKIRFLDEQNESIGYKLEKQRIKIEQNLIFQDQIKNLLFQGRHKGGADVGANDIIKQLKQKLQNKCEHKSKEIHAICREESKKKEQQISNYKEIVNNLERQADELRNECQQMEYKLIDKLDRINKMQPRLNKLEKENDRLSKQIDTEVAENRYKDKIIEQYMIIANKLEQNISVYQKDLMIAREQIESHKDVISDKSNEKKKLLDYIDEAHQKCKYLEEVIEQTERSLQQKNKELNQKDIEIRLIQKTIDHLNLKIESLQSRPSQQEEFIAQINDLNSKIEGYAKQNEELLKKINSLEQQNKNLILRQPQKQILEKVQEKEIQLPAQEKVNENENNQVSLEKDLDQSIAPLAKIKIQQSISHTNDIKQDIKIQQLQQHNQINAKKLDSQIQQKFTSNLQNQPFKINQIQPEKESQMGQQILILEKANIKKKKETTEAITLASPFQREKKEGEIILNEEGQHQQENQPHQNLQYIENIHKMQSINQKVSQKLLDLEKQLHPTDAPKLMSDLQKLRQQLKNMESILEQFKKKNEMTVTQLEGLFHYKKQANKEIEKLKHRLQEMVVTNQILQNSFFSNANEIPSFSIPDHLQSFIRHTTSQMNRFDSLYAQNPSNILPNFTEQKTQKQKNKLSSHEKADHGAEVISSLQGAFISDINFKKKEKIEVDTKLQKIETPKSIIEKLNIQKQEAQEKEQKQIESLINQIQQPITAAFNNPLSDDPKVLIQEQQRSKIESLKNNKQNNISQKERSISSFSNQNVNKSKQGQTVRLSNQNLRRVQNKNEKTVNQSASNKIVLLDQKVALLENILKKKQQQIILLNERISFFQERGKVESTKHEITVSEQKDHHSFDHNPQGKPSNTFNQHIDVKKSFKKHENSDFIDFDQAKKKQTYSQPRQRNSLTNESIKQKIEEHQVHEQMQNIFAANPLNQVLEIGVIELANIPTDQIADMKVSYRTYLQVKSKWKKLLKQNGDLKFRIQKLEEEIALNHYGSSQDSQKGNQNINLSQKDQDELKYLRNLVYNFVGKNQIVAKKRQQFHQKELSDTSSPVVQRQIDTHDSEKFIVKIQQPPKNQILSREKMNIYQIPALSLNITLADETVMFEEKNQIDNAIQNNQVPKKEEIKHLDMIGQRIMELTESDGEQMKQTIEKQKEEFGSLKQFPQEDKTASIPLPSVNSQKDLVKLQKVQQKIINKDQVEQKKQDSKKVQNDEKSANIITELTKQIAKLRRKVDEMAVINHILQTSVFNTSNEVSSFGIPDYLQPYIKHATSQFPHHLDSIFIEPPSRILPSILDDKIKVEPDETFNNINKQQNNHKEQRFQMNFKKKDKQDSIKQVESSPQSSIKFPNHQNINDQNFDQLKKSEEQWREMKLTSSLRENQLGLLLIEKEGEIQRLNEKIEELVHNKLEDLGSKGSNEAQQILIRELQSKIDSQAKLKSSLIQQIQNLNVTLAEKDKLIQLRQKQIQQVKIKKGKCQYCLHCKKKQPLLFDNSLFIEVKQPLKEILPFQQINESKSIDVTQKQKSHNELKQSQNKRFQRKSQKFQNKPNKDHAITNFKLQDVLPQFFNKKQEKQDQ